MPATADRLVQLPGRAIALADDDTGTGPATTWIQVLRAGKFWSSRYKDFSITKAILKRMVENFRTVTPKAPTELPLDYNHGTNQPDTIEQGKAAGWIKDVELRGDNAELWAQVELTPEAADLVRNKEYRYVSATFEFEHVHTDGELRKKNIGATLMAAALTNTPFVEGMEPVTLGKQAAIALDDDEAAETEFSYDEQRRRMDAALRVFGDDNMSGGWYCYLVDMFDGRAIYRKQPGGDLFEVHYAIDNAGDITFTDSPAECVADYRRLATPTGETEMAKDNVKVKDAAGNEIELSAETVKALAKEHGPKTPPVDDAAMDEIRTSLAKSETEKAELAERVAKLETDKKEMAAKGLVDALIRAGKVPLKKREQYISLAMVDRKTFDALTSDLPVIYSFNRETGSGDDGGDVSATQEVLALAREEMGRDTKLTQEQAITRVLSKNRALYERYKTEAAVRV